MDLNSPLTHTVMAHTGVDPSDVNSDSASASGLLELTVSCWSCLRQINMKTMPAVMFRLLTGQETPVYI